MSVEEAKDEVLDIAWGTQGSGGSIEPLLDRLITEVRAEMPCYECYVNHDGAPHNAKTCPSCAAKAELAAMKEPA